MLLFSTPAPPPPSSEVGAHAAGVWLCRASWHRVPIPVSSCSSLSWTTHRVFFGAFLCVCAPAPSRVLNHRSALSGGCCSASSGAPLLRQSHHVPSPLSVQLNTDDGQHSPKTLQQSSKPGSACCKEGFQESFYHPVWIRPEVKTHNQCCTLNLFTLLS